MSANHTFETIERAISEAVPELKTPLIPHNVPWFTVRPDDFPPPEIAKEILAAYGEDRGDGAKRLYRFPVVFPADMWQAVIPREEPSRGGREEVLERVHAGRRVPPVLRAGTDGRHRKRAIHIFGSHERCARKTGACAARVCGSTEPPCNLSGHFIFFIPGIKSIGRSSSTRREAAIQKFETIAFMRGRISGFRQKRTSLFITKLKEVPHDERAVPARWIIDLERRSASPLLRTEEGRDRDR
jgi:hypothetical protein